MTERSGRGFVKRAKTSDEVTGLKMERLQAAFQFAGKVRLHQLSEDLESLIAVVRWPYKTGPEYFACASTGLLFDKQSGRCLQSTNVVLLLDTVVAAPGKGIAYFRDWRKKQLEEEGWLKSNQAKRGPKPKGKAPAIEEEEFDASLDD